MHSQAVSSVCGCVGEKTWLEGQNERNAVKRKTERRTREWKKRTNKEGERSSGGGEKCVPTVGDLFTCLKSVAVKTA